MAASGTIWSGDTEIGRDRRRLERGYEGGQGKSRAPHGQMASRVLSNLRDCFTGAEDVKGNGVLKLRTGKMKKLVFRVRDGEMQISCRGRNGKGRGRIGDSREMWKRGGSGASGMHRDRQLGEEPDLVYRRNRAHDEGTSGGEIHTNEKEKSPGFQVAGSELVERRLKWGEKPRS